MKYSKDQLKEIILTSYIDGELSEEEKKIIDALIAQDQELQDLLKVAQESLEAFEGITQQTPPDTVWQNIQAEITPEPQEQQFSKPVGARVRAWFQFPNLVYRLAPIVFVVALGTAILPQQIAQTDYSKEEQIDYLMLLADADLGENEEDQFIENHFL